MIRRPPRSTPTYTPFPDPTLLRPPPLGRPRARRAIGLAQVQDRPLAVRAGRIMAHSNVIPPLDRSPESHASAWPVSAWDGRRQLRSNAEWVLPADACAPGKHATRLRDRSEEHTSELQSLMRISYAVFCLKKKTEHKITTRTHKLLH